MTTRKYLTGRVKELSDEPDGRLRIEGVASTGDTDADGESIAVAGWKWGDPLPPLGYGHDLRDPKNVIGRLDELRITDAALEFSGSINTQASAHHSMIASLVRGGDLVEFSVGFEPLTYVNPDGSRITRAPGDPWPFPMKGRRYETQRLMELSVVPIPANARAVLTAIKGLGLAVEPEPPVPGAAEVYGAMADALGSGKTLLERAADYERAAKLYGASAEFPEPPEFRPYAAWEVASIREFGVVVEEDWQWAVRAGLAPAVETTEAEEFDHWFSASGAGR